MKGMGGFSEVKGEDKLEIDGGQGSQIKRSTVISPQ